MKNIKIEYEEKLLLDKEYDLDEDDLEDLLNGDWSPSELVGDDIYSDKSTTYVKYTIYDEDGNEIKKDERIAS